MIRSLSTLITRVRALPKAERFVLYVTLTVLVAAGASYGIYHTVFRKPDAKPVAVAVIAPLSGPDTAIGQALRDGAAAYAESRNASDTGRPVRIIAFDSTSPDALARAAADPDVVAVIGPVTEQPQDEAFLAAHHLPRLSLSGASAKPDAWSQPLSADPTYEARFLANYVRNVIGEKLVSIILPDSPDDIAIAAAFDETLQRFGTRVVYRWTIPTDKAARTTALDASAHEIADKQVAGALLVLGDSNFAADTIAALGAARVTNRVIGLRNLGTAGFLDHLREIWRGPASMAATLNQTLFATPLLFDTADAEAQAFKGRYQAATKRNPDWLAVLGHDATQDIATAIDAMNVAPLAAGQDIRQGLRAELQRHRAPESALPGLAAPIFFDTRSGSAIPTLIGRFDGLNIVAAQTQLTPIRDEGVSNYLEQLASGRVLYVVDRFMYKTNVVSAGVRLNKITELNQDSNTADLDFMLWFRWRGNLPASDVVFENAVTPITLGPPERSQDDGDEHYRAWRVRGKFFLNASGLVHAYGTQLIDLDFRHHTLARNNLLYVADVVGMDLTGVADAAPTKLSRLAEILGVRGEGASPLLRQLNASQVLAGVQGWVVDRALISQDLTRAGSEGDPNYVGFGKPAPNYSRMSIDVEIKPDGIDLRGLLSESLLVYLAIFAFCGAMLANLLDQRDRGHIWRMQTLVLRLISWPVLLATGSAILLDYAVHEAGLAIIEGIDFIARALWWLMPARLFSLVVSRFIWAPLEIRSGRKIPTVFRMIVSLLIYVLAGFGIVSYVLGKPITSLLATSGLLTLILGLAVQSNLRDIFSGVMLNLERPFVMGDWVRINRLEGQVFDISWRTTRLRTRHGHTIALANGRVTEAEIENLTHAGMFDASITLYMDPRCPPEQVLAAAHAAVAKEIKYPFKFLKVTLKSIDNLNGIFAARYVIDMLVTDIKGRSRVVSAIWPLLWQELSDAGLLWALVPHRGDEQELLPSSNLAE